MASEKVTWTKEEVLEEARHVLKDIRDLFNEAGEIRPVSWLYGTRHPETGEESKGLVFMPVVGGFGDVHSKNQYAFLIRAVGKVSGAMGIIFASEIWTVDPEYHQRIGYEAAVKEAREWTGSLENHPHKMEAIYVSLEHHRLVGSTTWTARITRDAEGKPTLGEWKESQWPGNSKRHGRFLDMLPPVN